jgi:pyruvate dehydrogenase E2 component (dihydrolipoyllysine-residue acetyltransferase)
MTPINMPQVGQDIPTARIIEWTKREGEAVREGEVVAVVESDKATFEVQAEQAGVLLRISVPAGEEGEVFKPIAWIGQPREQGAGEASAVTGALAGGSNGETRDDGAPSATEAALEAAAPHGPFSSPSARRVACQHRVDLRGVKGTGPGGRILKEDVLAAVAARKEAEPSQPAAPAVEPPASHAPLSEGLSHEVVPFSRRRQRIADRLTLSKQTIPHFHLFQEVDMTDAQEWRRTFNRDPNCHVTVTDLILSAAARTLAEFPRLNAHVQRDRLLIKRSVNLGVATAVEDGLLVPVIPQADTKELSEISRFSKQIADAARRDVVDSTVEGTFTVSTLGQFGVPGFLPIINPPECGILGVGAVQSRVAPIAGGIGVRQMLTLILACDHRAVDGAYAARFLARLKELLETTWRLAPNQAAAVK